MVKSGANELSDHVKSRISKWGPQIKQMDQNKHFGLLVSKLKVGQTWWWIPSGAQGSWGQTIGQNLEPTMGA